MKVKKSKGKGIEITGIRYAKLKKLQFGRVVILCDCEYQECYERDKDCKKYRIVAYEVNGK